MKERIYITDVGPRDGLQNQCKILTVEQRLEMVRALDQCGLATIEFGSFVSPKAVPAMAGTDQIAAQLGPTNSTMMALIPNLKGYELAVAAGVRNVTMVLYASDGMAEKNVRMTRAEADAATAEILKRAASDGVEVTATISVSFHCPFDGPTDPAIVRDMTASHLDAGAAYVVVADTIGAATPREVSSLSRDLVESNGNERIGMHFHDTRSMGIANVYAAAEAGIRRFDASIAGIGGCPFAPGATGNVATEEVVSLLEQLGFDTGIDMPALLAASELTESLLGAPANVKSRNWLRKQYLGQR